MPERRTILPIALATSVLLAGAAAAAPAGEPMRLDDLALLREVGEGSTPGFTPSGGCAEEDFAVSPDGTRIVLVGGERPRQEGDAGAPWVVDRILYQTRTSLTDDRCPHLSLDDVDGEGEARALSAGPYDEHPPALSADGGEVFFVSHRGEEPDADHDNDRRVFAPGGEIRRLSRTSGTELAPAASPDGSAVAVAVASVSSLVSFYGTSLAPLLIGVEFGGKPLQRWDLLWHHSPLAHVDALTTWLLLVHGKDDDGMPIGQAEEMYMALRKRGVVTRLVRYPGAGYGFHGLSHRRDLYRPVLGWFERLLAAPGDG